MRGLANVPVGLLSADVRWFSYGDSLSVKGSIWVPATVLNVTRGTRDVRHMSSHCQNERYFFQ